LPGGRHVGCADRAVALDGLGQLGDLAGQRQVGGRQARQDLLDGVQIVVQHLTGFAVFGTVTQRVQPGAAQSASPGQAVQHATPCRAKGPFARSAGIVQLGVQRGWGQMEHQRPGTFELVGNAFSEGF